MAAVSAGPLRCAALLGLAVALLAVWPVVDGVAALSWATAGAAAWLLGALGTPVLWQGDLLRHAGGFVAEVHRDCTVLWPAVLLLGSLALLPGVWRGRGRGSLGALLGVMLLGVLCMWAVNQLRLAGVFWLAVHESAHYGWVHGALAPAIQVAALAAYVAATHALSAARGRPRETHNADASEDAEDAEDADDAHNAGGAAFDDAWRPARTARAAAARVPPAAACAARRVPCRGTGGVAVALRGADPRADGER